MKTRKLSLYFNAPVTTTRSFCGESILEKLLKMNTALYSLFEPQPVSQLPIIVSNGTEVNVSVSVYCFSRVPTTA